VALVSCSSAAHCLHVAIVVVVCETHSIHLLSARFKNSADNACKCYLVAVANSAFQQLRRANIWSSRALTLSVKMQFYQCIVMSVLLYSGETWAVVKQHISPLAVFQMNCLRRICGISLRDHAPNVVILNRCNTLSVESQLQGKRLRWLGHVFRMPNDRLARSFCLVKSRGFAHLAALGLVSMMLHYVIVKTFVLVGLIGMHKTGCSGETRLVLHVPSSS